MRFFLDTYALIEIAKGNKKFAGYLEDAATGPCNLLEFHFCLARDHGDEVADRWFGSLRSLLLDLTDADLPAASRLRRAERRRGLSYIDALGYVMAGQRGLRFVTGDKGFRGLDNVEMPT
ncbi:MAG: PIN domain-containing protein [Euryarchaeota archaeon]|nr:PIN domain-containing protein [Euryarchaeota archaeon]